MKAIAKKVKIIDQENFFYLYRTFIRESLMGLRLQKNGKRIKPQTVTNYIMAEKLVGEFVAETGFEIKLFLVNRMKDAELIKAMKYWKMFYIKFTRYMYQRGFFDNYVGMIIKSLRLFFNYLNNERQLQVGNFHKNFYVPKEDIPIIVLTPKQLRQLIDNPELDARLPADLQLTRDIFVFGCTVALRVSDLMSLRPYHLITYDEEYYLKVNSQKTNTTTTVKLPAYAVAILMKYKNKQSTLLPVLSINYFNLQLKRLSTYITGPEPVIKTRLRNGQPTIIYKDPEKKQHFTLADHITTHTMRRTAITTMLSLGMNEQVVRKISGHAANSKEFYKYVAFSQSFQDTETDKMFERLMKIN